MPTATASLKADFSQLIASIKAMPNTTKAESKRMVAAMRKAQREMTKQAKAQAKAQKEAAKQSGRAWKAAFGAISVAAIAAFGTKTVGAIKDFTTAVVDNRNELSDAAARTGLYSDTLQALRLSAESSGQEFSSLLKATERIPKLMGDAERGTKTVVQAFENLGVATHDADGNLRESDAVTRDLIRGLGDIDNATDKAVAGMALFGRAGGAVTQALGAGVDIFDQYDKIAERYGIETGPQAAATAARMQEEFARMGLIARGAGDDIWQAFGGDEGGALSTVRALSTGIIFITELLVNLRETFEAPGVETFLGPVALIKQARNIGHVSDAWAAASAASEEYLIIADETDRIVAGGSSAVSAFTMDLADNAKAAWEAAKAQKELQKAIELAAGIIKSSNEDMLSEREALTQAFIDQTEPLLDIIDLYGMESEAGIAALDALEAADKRLVREKQKLRDEELAAIAEQQAELDEIAKTAAEAQMELDRQVAHSKISLASTTAAALGSIAMDIAGDSKDAQLRAWRFSQAAAVAEAALNTALAISEASTSAPPPFNLIPMGAAAIQGAALQVAIATTPPPQAYTGLDAAFASSLGTSLPPVVHPGERIHVETRSEVERSRRPQMTTVQTYIGARQVADTVAEQVHRGGPLTAQVTRRTGRLGRSKTFRSI